MALNSSGPISLAGSTTGQSIALELGKASTAQTALNDSDVRGLAGVASGAITMPTNFWGKSSVDLYLKKSKSSNVLGNTYGNSTQNISIAPGGEVAETFFDSNTSSAILQYTNAAASITWSKATAGNPSHLNVHIDPSTGYVIWAMAFSSNPVSGWGGTVVLVFNSSGTLLWQKGITYGGTGASQPRVRSLATAFGIVFIGWSEGNPRFGVMALNLSNSAFISCHYCNNSFTEAAAVVYDTAYDRIYGTIFSGISHAVGLINPSTNAYAEYKFTSTSSPYPSNPPMTSIHLGSNVFFNGVYNGTGIYGKMSRGTMTPTGAGTYPTISSAYILGVKGDRKGSTSSLYFTVQGYSYPNFSVYRTNSSGTSLSTTRRWYRSSGPSVYSFMSVDVYSPYLASTGYIEDAHPAKLGAYSTRVLENMTSTYNTTIDGNAYTYNAIGNAFSTTSQPTFQSNSGGSYGGNTNFTSSISLTVTSASGITNYINTL